MNKYEKCAICDNYLDPSFYDLLENGLPVHHSCKVLASINQAQRCFECYDYIYGSDDYVDFDDIMYHNDCYFKKFLDQALDQESDQES